MKVVLDTNVLISGIFFSGPPARILKAWREGEIQFVLTREIVDEYFKVAKLLSEQFPRVEITSILNLIVARSNLIQVSHLARQVCQDPSDDKFLACALSSESETIISGDKHLLEVSGYRGITILTPRAFVDLHLRRQP